MSARRRAVQRAQTTDLAVAGVRSGRPNQLLLYIFIIIEAVVIDPLDIVNRIGGIGIAIVILLVLITTSTVSSDVVVRFVVLVVGAAPALEHKAAER